MEGRGGGKGDVRGKERERGGVRRRGIRGAVEGRRGG